MKIIANLLLRPSRLLCAVAAMGLVWSPAQAARLGTNWTGRVVYVVDGDTVHVQQAGRSKPVSVRIEGIDAPEICQPGGTAARSALQSRLAGQAVTVKSRAHDVYGRVVGQVLLNQESQGLWMVRQGLAWSYRFRGSLGPYGGQEQQARAQHIGIFAGRGSAAPVYPATFRKRHGSCYLPSRR